MLEKFFAAYIIPRFSFFRSQLFLHLDLCGNARMIRAGDPDYIVSFHSLKANENILQRIIQRMPHMKLPRYVRRRHDNTVRFAGCVGLFMKITLLLPKFIPLRFNLSGIILFQFFLIPLHT